MKSLCAGDPAAALGISAGVAAGPGRWEAGGVGRGGCPIVVGSTRCAPDAEQSAATRSARVAASPTTHRSRCRTIDAPPCSARERPASADGRVDALAKALERTREEEIGRLRHADRDQAL